MTTSEQIISRFKPSMTVKMFILSVQIVSSLCEIIQFDLSPSLLFKIFAKLIILQAKRELFPSSLRRHAAIT
jgi:hypothetical protein